jgi:hypothetical protein
MRRLFTICGLLLALDAAAVPCDCEVWVFAPMTASHRQASTILETYQLESYDSSSVKNQYSCRTSCAIKFRADMPHDRLSALLLTYSQRLIDDGVIGHNCTGLTTFKYPVRVKARLGRLALGNVEDIVQVVTHEEACF